MQRLRLAAAVGAALSLYSTAASAVSYPLPVTGHYTSGFASLESAIQGWAQDYGITGVTVAVVRDKRLVYERGFGYQGDPRVSTQEIYPDAKMRLASNSINVTRRALRQLVADGYLSESTKLVDALGPWIAPSDPSYYRDLRMRDITIGHVLNDTSCLTDDRLTPTEVGQALGLNRNATLAEQIRYAWTRSETMTTWFYCTLGTPGNFNGGGHYMWEIAAQIVAQKMYEIQQGWLDGRCEPRIINYADDSLANCVGYWYGDYVYAFVGKPVGAEIYQANNTPSGAILQEVWYDSREGNGPAGTDPNPAHDPTRYADWNRFFDDTDCSYDGVYKNPCNVPSAYYVDYYARPGSGTIVASARDVARLFSVYGVWNGLAKPSSLSSYCTGCTFVGNGSLPGARTTIVDTVLADSSGNKHPVTAVVLANRRVDDGDDPGEVPIETRVLNVLNATGSGAITWPTNLDLFDDVRIQSFFTGKYMAVNGSNAYVSLNTYDANSSRQRWRIRKDSSGYSHLVNAGLTTGMISNEDLYSYAEYLPPHNVWWSEQWVIGDTGWGTTVDIRNRWQSSNKLNALHSYSWVEQGIVSGTANFWYLQTVPSGPTTCSTSSTSPTCVCRTGTTPCSCQPNGSATCPAYTP